MGRSHHYEVTVSWTGETRSYRSYERAHEVTADGKAPIAGSSDPAFRGDPARWNPEELLVASLAQCHMLWFLHLSAADGVVVTGYTDSPTGVMVETADGGGAFQEVVLRPRVTLADPGQAHLLPGLHERAHGLCYIARSVNFPVRHEPS
ncbi:OsmC family protein [Actinoplanes xinjiangensis]|uniref:Organic hydroperoxide reductase OsmC/OhrA n=1 Tax=Actinoplanes xinjiangensis TaxID=512350 RepID=A0A316FGR2_9ACTN|nr:OsmC family protein [Actinoplanes xinjiangensis]PWK48131.1 organic hydroperoxide reductase OsmC/OhrA [Actinoplanes xinjiangensis]GIF39116.1 peroxiredoxin [Actinoplanes xinjiangensis]